MRLRIIKQHNKYFPQFRDFFFWKTFTISPRELVVYNTLSEAERFIFDFIGDYNSNNQKGGKILVIKEYYI